jgi:transglutaminase-like putative cysteine protease
MRPFFRPLPRSITRPISVLLLIAWIAAMAALVNRSYLQASSSTLATDLARYGSAAVWRGVYYRGDKIGFTVNQTVPQGDGFELQEDGRLQMSLLGATTAAAIRTTAQVDAAFALKSFVFSLDPGTGPLEIHGRLDGRRLSLDIKTESGTRSEVRDLEEPPAISLNLSRRLANGGLVVGARHRWTIFDPATLSNAPMEVEVGKRELVNNLGRPTPAFRVQMEFAGLRTTSWVTDTGEVIREESPFGLITVRESAESARAMAVSGRLRTDMLQTAAVVPRTMPTQIAESRDVRRMRLRLDGVDLSRADLEGVTQHLDGDVLELRDPQHLEPGQADPDASQYLAPEPFIESDAPEIIAESAIAVRGAADARARAEKLTRYVNALLDKKPTVSLPSAREVLRTKVGDCNEHTALYVAMARAAGIPARIAIGLVYIHGAFYYHAWPEVYIDDAPTRSVRAARGTWLPVDPTLNQFPADATHLRLARGGLEKQAAILPMMGRLKIDVLEVDLAPNSTAILAGKTPIDLGAIAIPIPGRDSSCCRCRR